MPQKYIEQEFAYEWRGPAKSITDVPSLSGWNKESQAYALVDSIYDTHDQALAKQSMGVRVRSKNGITKLTAKTFLKRGANGEGIFEERSVELANHDHPASIAAGAFDLHLPDVMLNRQLSFRNNRVEVTFRKADMLIRIVNEDVTYSDANGTHTEPLLEVEFEHVPDTVVQTTKKEIESLGDLRQIKEGKTDRALRFLTQHSTMHIQNIKDVSPIVMSAHGGKGAIQMRFFHTPFSRFDKADDPKVTNYQDGNWEFFAHATLPVGSEVKDHLHDRTDELYYILDGSATFTVDGQKRVVHKGDCILTRKNSRHSLTDITKDLEFIAIEVL